MKKKRQNTIKKDIQKFRQILKKNHLTTQRYDITINVI